MKKIAIIGVILILLTIGAVSAADEDMVMDKSAAKEYSNHLSDELLSENSEGTFQELSDLIKGTSENSTLELNKDYKNSNSNPITISKPITIDGKGHTLNADKLSRIFNVESFNVILKNIVFENGNSIDGTAIYANGCGGSIQIGSDCDNCEIKDCSFINSAADNGGAVYVFDNSDNLSIDNVNFINCHADVYGSAIFVDFDCENSNVGNCNFNDCSSDGSSTVNLFCTYDTTISNCNFKDCSAKSTAGAVEIMESTNCIINDCNFTACSAYEGGAINIWESDYIISNCNFNDCSADFNGGAINMYQEPDGENSFYGTIINCNFMRCSSKNYGGAVYLDCGKIEDSTFIGNHASYGGAIYNNSGNIVNSIFKNNTAACEGDDIYPIDDNSSDDNVPENGTNNSNAVSKNSNKSICAETGNPIMLLLFALAIPIIRNKN